MDYQKPLSPKDFSPLNLQNKTLKMVEIHPKNTRFFISSRSTRTNTNFRASENCRADLSAIAPWATAEASERRRAAALPGQRQAQEIFYE
jgi:hypothetical protein